MIFSGFCKAWLGFFMLMLAFTDALSAETISINHHQDTYSLTAPDYVITDQDQTVLASDSAIKWQPFNADKLVKPTKEQALWLKFNVILPATIADDWVLSVRLTTLRLVQVYTRNTVTLETWQSDPAGIKYPKPLNEKMFRHPTFKLPLSNDQLTTVLVKVVSAHVLIMPINIIKQETFEADSQIDLLIIGAILGSILIMLLYNLSLYSLLRSSAYFYYSAYVFSTLLYLTSLTGIGPLYIWPHSNWFLEFATVTFSAITFFFATLFFREFLKLKIYRGIMFHVTNLLLILWGILSVLLAITSSPIVISALVLATFITCVAAIWISLSLSLKKLPTAIIFMFAWLVLILGTAVYVSMRQGLLPVNTFTVYSQMIGIVIELVLLSFALAFRINLDRKKRENAQLRALLLEEKVIQEKNQRIKAQGESLELQRLHNLTLENQVTKRTRQYEEVVAKLEVLNDELTSLTLTDTLTEIANRRHFDRSLKEECRRAFRDQNCLAVIFIDIDKFKQINDTYGHGVGDVCIKTIASLLNEQAGRSGDLVARYGGEEFVYMLSNTSEEDACKMAEKARTKIELATIETESGQVSVTASFGVAAWIPSVADECTLFVNTADSALYQAKENGRNQVVALSNDKSED
jgi:diguanylate cyclase